MDSKTLPVLVIISRRASPGRESELRDWADELTAAAEAAQLPILTPPVPKRQAIADATETARGLDEGDAQSRDLAVIYAAHIDQLMKGTAHV